MFSIPLLVTIYAGFTHAFEADHVLAVSNIVSRRNNVKVSLKDGIYWGLGHASTIFIIGVLMIFFKATISEQAFRYLEAIVGCMLIALAIYRLIKCFGSKNTDADHHPHTTNDNEHQHPHALAYGVGLVHGLAGSGALVVLVMAQMKGTMDGLIYLVIFGVGCTIGMMLASGLLSFPFSKRFMHANLLQTSLVIISSVLCLLYGGKLFYENLLA